MDAGLLRCWFCLNKYHWSFYTGNSALWGRNYHRIFCLVIISGLSRWNLSPPRLRSNRVLWLTRWTALAPGFPLVLAKAGFWLEGQKTWLVSGRREPLFWNIQKSKVLLDAQRQKLFFILIKGVRSDAGDPTVTLGVNNSLLCSLT